MAENYLGYTPKTLVDKATKLISSNEIVLDVGAGFGDVLGYLLQKGRNVYGLDINIQNLRKMKGNVLKADAERLPFKDCSISVILCFEVVEHLVKPENFLAEAKRVLKEKGLLFLSTPTPASGMLPEKGYSQHISVWERKVWIEKLKKLGFKVDVVVAIYSVAGSKLLTLTLGRLIGVWKRYVNVTSTKLICEKP